MSYHQEDEVIDPIIFAATVGLGNRINKLFSSNFMDMVSSVSVIFDTGATYSYSSNKGDFVKLEDDMLPRKLKGIAKGLEIFGFGIVEYFFRSESGRNDCAPVLGVLCSLVNKVLAHNFPTRHLHVRRIQR